jgi:hypothetical protein
MAVGWFQRVLVFVDEGLGGLMWSDWKNQDRLATGF